MMVKTKLLCLLLLLLFIIAKSQTSAGGIISTDTTWYAEHLPGGIYFSQIQAGSFADNKKMILLK